MKSKYIIPILVILIISSICTFADTPLDFTVSPTSLILNYTHPFSNITIINLTTRESNLNFKNNTLLNSLNEKMEIIVFNSTENSTKLNLSQPINITIYPNMTKPAGRYEGNLIIYNKSSPSNNTSVNIIVDVPINFINNIGNFSGNTTNTTINIFYFIANKSFIDLSINLTDLSNNVSIVLKNSTESLIKNITTPGNLFYSFMKNQTDFGGDDKFWIIEIKGLTNDYTSYNGTIAVNKPSFIVNNIITNTTQFNFLKNLGQPKNFSIQINISNIADYNLTIKNITNSSGKLFLNTNSSKYFNLSFDQLTLDYNLTPGSMLNLNVSINSTSTSDTIGDYYGWILINTSNGYPYKIFNTTFKASITDELNVSIISFTKKDSNENPTQNDNITITTNVTYKDGMWTNYTDNSLRTFIAWLEHSQNSNYKRNCTVFDQSTTDHYTFYCNISNNSAGGNYTLFVRVNDTNKNIGIGSRIVIINTSAVSIDSVPVEIVNNKGEYEYIDVIVKNVGYQNATKIVLAATYGNCVQVVSTNSSYINSQGFNLTPNEQIRIENAWKIKLSTAGNCVFTIYGSSFNGSSANKFFIVKNASIPITVNEQSSEEDQQGYSWPVGISIISYPNPIIIEQGGNYNAIIKVKNIGNFSLQNVKIWVLNISNDWWIQPGAQNIPYGEEISFFVQFKIPETATPGDYNIKFVVNTSGVSKSVDGILKIIKKNVTQEVKNITIEEINKTLVNYTQFYKTLKSIADELRAKGKNITSLEEILNETENMISKAQAFLILGNTAEAEKLTSEISIRLSSIKQQFDRLMEEVKQSEVSNYITIGIVVIISVAILIIIYLFVPRKSGYIPGVGYRHITHETRFKELLNKLREKIKKKESYSYKPKS